MFVMEEYFKLVSRCRCCLLALFAVCPARREAGGFLWYSAGGSCRVAAWSPCASDSRTCMHTCVSASCMALLPDARLLHALFSMFGRVGHQLSWLQRSCHLGLQRPHHSEERQPPWTHVQALFKTRFLLITYTTHPKGQRLTSVSSGHLFRSWRRRLADRTADRDPQVVLHHMTALSISPLFSVDMIS